MAPRLGPPVPANHRFSPGVSKAKSRIKRKKAATNPRGGGVAPLKVTRSRVDTATGGQTRTKVTLKKNKFGLSTPGLGTLPDPKKGKKRPPKTGAETPKAPATTRRASTTTRSTTTSPPPSTTTSTQPPKSDKPPKKAPKKAPKTEQNPTTPGTETEDDPITGLYAAARRDIDRRQQLADATRLARLEDQKKFDEWVAAQRGSANDSMQAAFARSAADAQAARQASYDQINQLATQAMRQSSGVADLLKQAGTEANQEAYGFRTAADAQNSTIGAFNTAAQAQRLNSQSEADRARAANMVSAYNAQNFAAREALNQERSQLSLEEIKSRMEQANADRQYRLDQTAAQFLQGLQQGELEVKQYEAQTERQKVVLTARQQAEANRIRAAVADGQMTMRQAELELKKKRYGLEKRKQILAEAQRGGDGDEARRESVEFLNKWNNDNLAQQGLAAAPRGDAGIAYGRSAVQALKAYNRNMTAQAALRTLASVLPGDVLRDNRILQAVDAAFR